MLGWIVIVGVALAGAQAVQTVAASLLGEAADVDNAVRHSVEQVDVLVTIRRSTGETHTRYVCRTTRDRVTTDALTFDADTFGQEAPALCDLLVVATPAALW